MDWDVIASYLPQYEKAAWLTLRLGVIGIVWAIGIGLVCAVLQYDKVPVLRRLVGAYIQLSRNTPLLVQLFFIYYGLPKVGIKTNAEIPLSINLITRMIKTTSLVLMIGVVEVLKVAQQIIEANRRTAPNAAFGVFAVVFLLYFLICWPISRLAGYLEKRWS